VCVCVKESMCVNEPFVLFNESILQLSMFPHSYVCLHTRRLLAAELVLIQGVMTKIQANPHPLASAQRKAETLKLFASAISPLLSSPGNDDIKEVLAQVL
jgi:hypothetical protein